MQIDVIKQTATSVLEGARQAFFPLSCTFCDQGLDASETVAICPVCRDALTADSTSLCQRCGVQVNPLVQHVDGCPHCRHAKFRFANVVTLGPYQGDLRTAIVRMKRSSEQCLTHAVGLMLAALAQQRQLRFDEVLPVPMHWTRRAIRGSNSAERLAEAVAATYRLRWRPSLVRQNRRTKKQSLLDPADRRRNLAGAFKVARWADLKGKNVAVVDDTMTTGTTMNELARCLRRAGAAGVTAVVAARTPKR